MAKNTKKQALKRVPVNIPHWYYSEIKKQKRRTGKSLSKIISQAAQYHHQMSKNDIEFLANVRKSFEALIVPINNVHNEMLQDVGYGFHNSLDQICQEFTRIRKLLEKNLGHR